MHAASLGASHCETKQLVQAVASPIGAGDGHTSIPHDETQLWQMQVTESVPQRSEPLGYLLMQQLPQPFRSCEVQSWSGPPQTPLMQATPLQHSWLSLQEAPGWPQAVQLPT
jgi:hypothetical protein